MEQKSDRGQVKRRPDRPGDHRCISGENRIGQRPDLIEIVLEACHTQVQDLGRLLASDMRGLAGLYEHGAPRTHVFVEDMRQALPARLCAITVTDGEDPTDRLTTGVRGVQSPGGGDAILGSDASDAVCVGDPPRAAESDRDPQRDGDGRHSPARSSPTAFEECDHLIHRSMAVITVRGHATLDDVAQPPWSVGPGMLQHVDGRVLGASKKAGGPRSEQRLVERDGEAELIGARVDRFASELFRRHVRRRAH